MIGSKRHVVRQVSDATGQPLPVDDRLLAFRTHRAASRYAARPGLARAGTRLEVFGRQPGGRTGA